ncbi:MAG: YraN family protein [Candidatus Omnitrophica bacterium]|nr:YraN family protein [Candidatus Omnitrophota bacterium]
MKDNRSIGKNAEEAAVDFLRKSGYRIIKRNYRTRLGEIDIIAREKDTLCFIEVKSRSALSFGLPEEAVSLSKQRQLSKTALVFLKETNSLTDKSRFDVISIIGLPGQEKIELIKNAFGLCPEFIY